MDEQPLPSVVADRTIQGPPAPTGDEAFGQIVLYWLLKLDVRSLLHPAVQNALDDSYQNKHLSQDKPSKLRFEDSLLGTAFFRNYDQYNLLRWQSNHGARVQMVEDYPQHPLPDDKDLPTLEQMPKDLQEHVLDIVEHRESLPVIMRKPKL